MGCHTWAYRKVKQDEIGKMKNILVDCLKSDYRYVPEDVTFDEHVNDKYKKLVEAYGCEDICTKKSLADEIKKGNADIRNIMKKLESECTLEFISDAFDEFVDCCDYKVINGSLYRDCGFDVPCRIYGYPEETFTDAEEFIKWIQSKEANGKKISECWNEDDKIYSDGFDENMAREIRKFWKLHNNEVYVEFG